MKPRVALLMSGLPRFRADTDSLIDNLINYKYIDWYVAFWKHNPKTLNLHDARWQQLTEAEMISAIQSRLPLGQRVKTFKWIPETAVPPMPRDYPPFYSYPVNCWQQYSILKIVNEIKQQSLFLSKDGEHITPGGPYDLIIRARADAGSDRPIDLEMLATQLGDLELHMPNNQRLGPFKVCDHWCIGRSSAINHLANVVNYFDSAFQQGVPYNPEYLLGAILSSQGLTWPPTEWNSVIKIRGTYGEGGFHPDPGRWTLPE